MRLFLFCLTVLSKGILFAQSDSAICHHINLHAYVDAYASYFSDHLPRNKFELYTTTAPRNGVIGLNIAQLGFSYKQKWARSTVVFQVGDMPNADWTADFPYIQQANIGIRLVKGLWLDAGFFTTHIGTEGYVPRSNLLSSTTVGTYNEPFFESGFKLSYEGWKKLSLSIYGLSGYNRFLDNNKDKSVGLLLTYGFNDNLSIAYSNILGNEQANDSLQKQFRFYNNLFMNAKGKKWKLVFGGDYALQSHSGLIDSSKTAMMFSALASFRYYLARKWSATLRGEIIWDADGFIAGTHSNSQNQVQGTELWGVTLGMEYAPVEDAYIRIECRYLQSFSDFPLFYDNKNTRWEGLLTMGYYFNKSFDWKGNGKKFI